MAGSMIKKKLLILLLMVLCPVLTCVALNARGWRRATYLRYLSARCEYFRRMGESVLSYTKEHGGAIMSKEEMIATLAQQCTSLPTIGFMEEPPPSEFVCREIPNTSQDGNLILAFERISAYDDDLIVLYLDGHVSVSPRPKVTLERDDELRKKYGLPSAP